MHIIHSKRESHHIRHIDGTTLKSALQYWVSDSVLSEPETTSN
jgi:hypothetical protein